MYRIRQAKTSKKPFQAKGINTLLAQKDTKDLQTLQRVQLEQAFYILRGSPALGKKQLQFNSCHPNEHSKYEK